MDLKIKNHSFFVTGGSSGIGKDIVMSLLKEGALVTTCARDIDKLNELKISIPNEYKKNLLTLNCDVLNLSEMKTAIESSVSYFEKLDGVVANAGSGISGNTLDTDMFNWISQYEIKVASVLNLVKSATPYLIKSNHGKIVIMNGVTANIPDYKMAAVSAARASVQSISYMLAVELAKYNICCNTINIGAIETGRQLARFKEHHDGLSYTQWIEKQIKERRILFNRFGTPEDVSPMVMMLLSPITSYITGSSIDISGGMYANI